MLTLFMIEQCKLKTSDAITSHDYTGAFPSACKAVGEVAPSSYHFPICTLNLCGFKLFPWMSSFIHGSELIPSNYCEPNFVVHKEFLMELLVCRCLHNKVALLDKLVCHHYDCC